MSKIEFDPQSAKCLFCDSNRLSAFKAQAFDATDQAFVNIVECDDCAFAWQYPLGRTEDQSAEFFEVAYKDQGKTQSAYFNPDTKRHIAQQELEFLNTLSGNNKTLLDIGAGAGIFAEVAAEMGWAVTAVDPALDVERLKSHPSITAIKGTTDDIPNGERYDCITLWDVIEHATNPIQLIADARQRLNHNGWLVIETGNYKSADRVGGGLRSWMYQLDHRWYFSPESMMQLLKEAGFCEFVAADKVLRPGWNGSAVYAGPSRMELVKAVLKNPLRIARLLSRYFSLIQVKKWERSGIGIFAIAARKNPADA